MNPAQAQPDQGTIGLRDARFTRALQSAPDQDAVPAAASREAVLRSARLALAQDRAQAGAPTEPGSRAGWWRWLAPAEGSGAPWKAAFATLLLGGFITLLWQGQEPPGALPERPTAAIKPALTPPEIVPQPAALPALRETEPAKKKASTQNRQAATAGAVAPAPPAAAEAPETVAQSVPVPAPARPAPAHAALESAPADSASRAKATSAPAANALTYDSAAAPAAPLRSAPTPMAAARPQQSPPKLEIASWQVLRITLQGRTALASRAQAGPLLVGLRALEPTASEWQIAPLQAENFSPWPAAELTVEWLQQGQRVAIFEAVALQGRWTLTAPAGLRRIERTLDAAQFQALAGEIGLLLAQP
ncbi:MAG: hypothetical protein ACKVOO_08470 [Burkholderiaceae bacterium]